MTNVEKRSLEKRFAEQTCAFLDELRQAGADTIRVHYGRHDTPIVEVKFGDEGTSIEPHQATVAEELSDAVRSIQAAVTLLPIEGLTCDVHDAYKRFDAAVKALDYIRQAMAD